jgi:transcriptional antiterminator RfaH
MTLHIETKRKNASDHRQWFTVQTHAMKENIAKVNFENQGFKVYYPEIKVIRKHARRVDITRKAFFPGYLFIHLASDECQWQSIASTRGAIKPVRFGEYYPPVPDWVIVELRSREDENGLIILDETEKFKTGDRVKISLPANIEQTGIFQALHGNERALILLNILQEQARTVVPLSALSFC